MVVVAVGGDGFPDVGDGASLLSMIRSGHGSKGSCSAGGAANKFYDASLAISGRDSSIVVLTKELLAAIMTCCLSTARLSMAASRSNLVWTTVMATP
jgi:hypothetical protein